MARVSGGRVRHREPQPLHAPKHGAKRGRSRGGACNARDPETGRECSKSTTEGKAKCLDHITAMPYVLRILSGEAEAD